jgi:hypothetical protein
MLKLILASAIGYYIALVLWELTGITIAYFGRLAVRFAAEQIKARSTAPEK